jgi:hypothetical protein
MDIGTVIAMLHPLTLVPVYPVPSVFSVAKLPWLQTSPTRTTWNSKNDRILEHTKHQHPVFRSTLPQPSVPILANIGIKNRVRRCAQNPPQPPTMVRRTAERAARQSLRAATAAAGTHRWNTGRNWFGAPSDNTTSAVVYELPNGRSRCRFSASHDPSAC